MNPHEIALTLQKGLKALQNQQYELAIEALEMVCRQVPNQKSPEFLKAQMALVRAYRALGKFNQSRELCEYLTQHPNLEVQNWAKTMMLMLLKQENGSEGEADEDVLSTDLKAGRAENNRVKVALPRVADSLPFIFGTGLFIPLLTTSVLFIPLVWWLVGQPWQNILLISLGLGILVNCLALFYSTPVIDLINRRIYGTEWVNLGAVQKYSPEAGELMLRVARAQTFPIPKLGIIPDNRPVMFTYGVQQKNTRIVISQGIFRYLSAEEIATLFGHELAHIVRWDCALLTCMAGWGQLFYWWYCELQTLRSSWPAIAKILIAPLVWVCLAVFRFNQMANRYLARTREYYADHFAVNYTGNPNALIRALVKMTRALVKQERQAERPALFLEGMRNFANYDAYTAAACERGERFDPRMVGNLLLWDWGSPWRGIITGCSSHPLLGKRLQVLSHYAEQLDLDTEYNLVLSRRQISLEEAKKRTFSFYLEVFIWLLPIWCALALGWWTQQENPIFKLHLHQAILIGLGAGILLRTTWQSLGQRKVAAPTVLSLLSDPNLSPIWGTQVNWQGKLRLVQASIWRAPRLYFHDRTGVIPVRYPGWTRLLPPFRSLRIRLEAIALGPVKVSGMVVRGLSPQLQIVTVTNEGDEMLIGYPLFLSWTGGGLLLLLGILLKG
ncbi:MULTISPECIES: M48 family metalloprotease [unclassified Synechocystis]|uniref:M48 family metalloprotease n=1 Tax=unclassified Synechocystis TaxID=2640012 RepID=UPI0004156E27|nr:MULTISPECIES: M48 family metalloprotease [unclassified Synechocystis]AIE72841.1 peptidase, M48B family [Synechocystis sp. PCC 6714]MCT0254527.1 M48 family metalloprotease [Synechocystis sp. CS-94]